MLLLVQALTATIAGQETAVLKRLPGLLTELLDHSHEMVKMLGHRTAFESLFYLGSGPRYGLANEAMLKMKEMSLSHSSGFHFLEFRHGPMSMVSEDALIIGLVSEQARRHEAQVLQEMAALGGVVLEVNADSASTSPHQIAFGEPVPAWAQPVLYLPPLQLLAYYRAMAKGLDPDSPRNLEAVIYLDETAFAPG
jgi:glucosamine--fructose-6-phosphate aminotransferase (isomerizing)